MLLREVQQPPGPAEGRRDRRRERHLHRLREHQPRRPPRRRLGRLQRGDAPPPRRHRRDAPPPAVLERPGLAQDAGDGAQARPARPAEGLRLPFDLQRRHRRRGAAPAGQDARRRARRRLQRLRGGGRLRQGGLHPHRLLQPREGPRARAPRRRRPADRRPPRPGDGRGRIASRRSTTSTAPSRRSSSTSSR